MKNKYRNTSRTKTPWDNHAELTPLETFIKSSYLDSFNYKHPALQHTSESDLLNSYVVNECHHCSSNHFKKIGFNSNGVQRYLCLDCHRSFNILTNTLFDEHKISISEWIEFCLDIFRYESINITSKANKNSFSTSKYWIHKLFIVLNSIQDDILLKGTVYIDETFFPVTKEDKILNNGKELRGLSRNQYCIAIGYDKTHVYTYLEGYGKTSQAKTKSAFITHIESESHLVHDKEKSHRILVKELNLEDESYDAKKLKNTSDKENPLNPINRQCFLLKKFLRAHDGFNRENLNDYLNMFCFIQNPPHTKLEKVRILLDSAIQLPKSLRYRDFYNKKP